MRTAIELINLSKNISQQSVVQNLNIRVKSGEIYALLGLNGAGKTTIIKMMLGLTIPTSGEVKYFNKSFLKHKEDLLPRIGSVIEHSGFYEHLSVFDNLRLITNIVGIHKMNYIDELLETVELNHKKYDKVRTLNLHEQQKLAIARALLNNPSILVLDEPFSGLDMKAINDIRTLLIRLSREKQTTIFISSHILSEIDKVADRVAILDHGKVIKIFNRDYLRTNQMMRTVIQADDLKLLYERLYLAGFKNYFLKNNQITLTEQLSLTEMMERVNLNNLKIIELYTEPLSLEDYFMELVSEGNL